MKVITKMALAGLAGVFVGAGTTTLLAQTATPKAYVLANLAEIKDAAGYKTYSDKVGATQAPFEGHVIARGPAQALDSQSGSWAANPPPKGNIVLIEFPSMEKLQAWWHSPAYSAIRPIRENATLGSNFSMMGVPPG